MAGNRKSGGANVALTTRKRRSGGAWADLTIARRRSGGAWIDLFALTATVQTNTYSSLAISPADSSIAAVFSNLGVMQISQNGGGSVTQYTWQGGGAASDYDIMATVTSGSVTGSPTGSWLNLASSQSWAVTRTSNIAGTTSAVISVQIRNATTLAVLATGTLNLDAVVDV